MVWGLECECGVGLRFKGRGSKFEGVGCRVWVVGYMVWGLECGHSFKLRVKGRGSRLWGVGCRVQVVGCMAGVHNLGFGVLGLGFWL